MVQKRRSTLLIFFQVFLSSNADTYGTLYGLTLMNTPYIFYKYINAKRDCEKMSREPGVLFV